MAKCKHNFGAWPDAWLACSCGLNGCGTGPCPRCGQDNPAPTTRVCIECGEVERPQFTLTYRGRLIGYASDFKRRNRLRRAAFGMAVAMALPGSGVVNRGLQITGGRTFNTADAFAAVQALGIDDATGNFEAAHTAINGAGGTARTISNSYFQNFDATPTRSSQTITMTTTIPTGSGNFTTKGISLHNATAGSCTTSSTTLFAGIAGQSITKTSSFSLAITLQVAYTDNS